MEQSLSSLAFRGSIVEAIAEAKQQKKLFVVYIGGDNEESRLLESSTWINPKVSETVSKYCVLLHILEGSLEASNFSAIYPQHPAPCITVVGYNGVQLWQQAGCVSADVLSSTLEKAWLSLHFQETTAAFLTAALASGTSETGTSQQVTPEKDMATPLADDHVQLPVAGQSLHSQTIEHRKSHEDGPKETTAAFLTAALASGTSETGTSQQVTPEKDMATPLADDHVQLPVAGQSLHSQTIEHRKSHEDGPKETVSKQDIRAVPESSLASVTDSGVLDESIKARGGIISDEHVEIQQCNPEVAYHPAERTLDIGAVNLSSSNVVAQGTVSEANEMVHVKDVGFPKEAEASDSSTIKSNDVFLNIKLPDGSSLQVKFSVMDTLKMVKNYIIEKQVNSLGSFSIAVPYPRRIFSDQDLGSTLSDLGLCNRQALVVVPHTQQTSHYRGGSLDGQSHVSNDTGSSNANDGYWASVRKVLSYVNPLSYLNRSSSAQNAAEESPGGLWQYSPNPSLQNNLRYEGRLPPNPSSSDQSTPSSSGDSIKKRRQTSGFGANIHTLKHDEDGGRFNDRNAFWNGNSTQYGGDNDGQ